MIDKIKARYEVLGNIKRDKMRLQRVLGNSKYNGRIVFAEDDEEDSESDQ